MISLVETIFFFFSNENNYNNYIQCEISISSVIHQRKTLDFVDREFLSWISGSVVFGMAWSSECWMEIKFMCLSYWFGGSQLLKQFLFCLLLFCFKHYGSYSHDDIAGIFSNLASLEVIILGRFYYSRWWVMVMMTVISFCS